MMWYPSRDIIEHSNIYRTLQELHLPNYPALHKFSITQREAFWEYVVQHLALEFTTPYTQICDLSHGVKHPRWLADARYNIAANCFHAAPHHCAIVYQNENEPHKLNHLSYQQLHFHAQQVAQGLQNLGFKPGARIALLVPMSYEAVAIYLGIILAGCTAVGIAESFSTPEIATRLQLTEVAAVFTQDIFIRDGKQLALYAKISPIYAGPIIVITKSPHSTLRSQDLSFDNFLHSESTISFTPPALPSDHPITILFSSGTTGVPKAIIWDQTTPIKCASDGYFHMDLHAEDIYAWPTSMGWMMGPWLVFACLLNQCTMALYNGSPLSTNFGKFIEQAQVNVLGVVPSMIKHWRQSQCMKACNWQHMKLFSSTAECSNVDDMLYLMQLGHGAPIIEYCGGTEIGGAYVTSTIVEPNAPSTFTTPALGLDFLLIDEEGHPLNVGEVALLPPSIGLSTQLLHGDHDAVYYADMPKGPQGEILRRHGDALAKMNGSYRALGRVDDTMKIGGIKVSAREIEEVLNHLPEVFETAAVAIAPPEGGPSQLVIFVVLKDPQENLLHLQEKMQQAIKNNLNPLFKIARICPMESLPRTASNKIMRRVLRDKSPI